jgi:excisionase family DNA binding protein
LSIIERLFGTPSTPSIQNLLGELLDEETAAEHLGISVSTLRRHRHGEGGRARLPVVKIGRSVRFARADLNQFAAAHRKAA